MVLCLRIVIGKVQTSKVEAPVHVVLHPFEIKIAGKGHTDQRGHRIGDARQGEGERGVEVYVDLVVAIAGVCPICETQRINLEEGQVVDRNHQVPTEGEPVIEVVTKTHGIPIVACSHMEVGDLERTKGVQADEHQDNEQTSVFHGLLLFRELQPSVFHLFQLPDIGMIGLGPFRQGAERGLLGIRKTVLQVFL